MTPPVDRLSPAPTGSSGSRPDSGPDAGVFDASLSLEQADVLLRSTNQYGLWRHIRRKDANKAQTIAALVLQRNQALQQSRNGKSINWLAFDQLTRDLQLNGIMLPTSRQLAPPTDQNAPSSPQIDLSLLPPPAAGPPPAGNIPPASGPSLAGNTSPETDPANHGEGIGAPTEANAAAVPAKELLQEENTLILGASCPEIALQQDILGYSDGQATLLPLGGLSQALDFSINVEPAQGKAQGWFISEGRTLGVDAARKKIQVDGKSIPWDDTLIAVGEDDIYVDTRLLSQMLPLDCTVDSGEMTLRLHPRETLPLQAQLEREQRRKRLGREAEDMRPQHPVQEPPFRAASFPIMDVAMQGRVDKPADRASTLRQSYSVLAQGDLAYMGSDLFVSGHKDEPLDNVRLTLKRTDPNAGLLGSLQARTLALGDVSPVDLPVLAAASWERGVMISNQALQHRRDFDSTRFEGNAQPGWDVELYHNDSLLQSMRVGGDGRYVFENAPIYFGSNRFEIVAHGPQGQRRVLDTRNINIGSEMLKKGEMEYNLSATQRQTSLFGERQTSSVSGAGPRLTAQTAYGLTDTLSATAGTSSVEFADKRHTYLQAGLNHSLSALYTSVNAVTDITGGSALSAQAQGRIGGFNLSGKHEIFSHFIEERNPQNSLEERTTLALSGRTPQSWPIPAFSYSLSRSESSRAEGNDTKETGLRLSTSLKGVHLTNQVYWRDKQVVNPQRHDGEFRASGYLGGSRITAGIDYDIDGNSGITRYQVEGSMPLSGDIRARASLFHDTEYGDRETEGEIGLDLDLGKVMLSPNLSYNSDGDFRAFAGLSFSLGKDPLSGEMEMRSTRRSGQGAATAFVYHDANNNQVFDQDDAPIPDAKVVVRQSRQDARTGEDGRAQFISLNADNAVDVELDPESLADPFWTPATPGHSIRPRAGIVQPLSFPVVTSGEIDGSVLLSSGHGGMEPLSNVRLELRDQNGKTVQTALSEYDGFYLFSKVRPGDYTLHIASKDPKIQGVAEGWSKPVTIGLDGAIVRGNDIVLSPDQQPPASPSPDPAAPAQAATPEPDQKPARRQMAPEPVQPAPVQPPPVQPAPVSPTAEVKSVPASFTIRPLTIVEREASPAPEPAPPRPKIETAQPATPGAPGEAAPASRFYAAQLASYSSLERARAGIRILAGRLQGLIQTQDLRIVRVDLGQRGVFYRVVGGQFPSRTLADQLTRQIQALGHEVLTIPVERNSQALTASAPAATRQPARPAAQLIAQKYAAMQGRI